MHYIAFLLYAINIQVAGSCILWVYPGIRCPNKTSTPSFGANEECCQTKTLGGHTYNYVGEKDTQEFNCSSNCTYTREDKPDSLYCFRLGGKYHSECSGALIIDLKSPMTPIGMCVAPGTDIIIQSENQKVCEMSAQGYDDCKITPENCVRRNTPYTFKPQEVGITMFTSFLRGECLKGVKAEIFVKSDCLNVTKAVEDYKSSMMELNSDMDKIKQMQDNISTTPTKSCPCNFPCHCYDSSSDDDFSRCKCPGDKHLLPYNNLTLGVELLDQLSLVFLSHMQRKIMRDYDVCSWNRVSCDICFKSLIHTVSQCLLYKNKTRCTKHRDTVKTNCKTCFCELKKKIIPQVECPRDEPRPELEQEPESEHPCNRNCTDSKPFRCVFDFKLEKIPSGHRADGHIRMVVAYNGKIPGPPIVICEGDELVVNLKNNLDINGENTTLHFHGIGEMYTPGNDGVPWVTQYPVLPGDSFTYGFNASGFFGAAPGTYWYHSHVSDQRVNGAYGALIIKPKNIVPDKRFDIDNADNTIIVQEWYEDENSDKVKSLLINGKGRVENDSPGYMVYNVSYEKRYIFRVIGAISQNFPLRLSIDNHTFTAIAADSKDIESVEELTDLWIASGERFDIVVQTKPQDQTQEKMYKIRVFGYENPFNKAGNFCTIAWLKYENQEIIREYLTESDCSSFVIEDLYPYLRTLNPVPNNFDEWQNRIKFPQWKNITLPGEIFVKDLIGKVQNPTLQLKNQTYLNTQYQELVRETFNNITMEYPEVPFLLQNGSDKANQCGEVCNFKVKPAECLPTLTYLRTSCAIKLDAERCQLEEHCSCSHVMKQSYAPGYWFDMILINGGESPETAHPIHKHGGWFAVVGMDMFNRSVFVNRTFIKDKDEDCENYKNHHIPCLPRNFIYPSEKDTIQVPTNGYVILRIPTDNAGTWLMHCHINRHFKNGMAMVIQIGGFHAEKNYLQKWCTSPII